MVHSPLVQDPQLAYTPFSAEAEGEEIASAWRDQHPPRWWASSSGSAAVPGQPDAVSDDEVGTTYRHPDASLTQHPRFRVGLMVGLGLMLAAVVAVVSTGSFGKSGEHITQVAASDRKELPVVGLASPCATDSPAPVAGAPCATVAPGSAPVGPVSTVVLHAPSVAPAVAPFGSAPCATSAPVGPLPTAAPLPVAAPVPVPTREPILGPSAPSPSQPAANTISPCAPVARPAILPAQFKWRCTTAADLSSVGHNIEWCKTKPILNGKAFQFFDLGPSNPCGQCWCCVRDILGLAMNVTTTRPVPAGAKGLCGTITFDDSFDPSQPAAQYCDDYTVALAQAASIDRSAISSTCVWNGRKLSLEYQITPLYDTPAQVQAKIAAPTFLATIATRAHARNGRKVVAALQGTQICTPKPTTTGKALALPMVVTTTSAPAAEDNPCATVGATGAAGSTGAPGAALPAPLAPCSTTPPLVNKLAVKGTVKFQVTRRLQAKTRNETSDQLCNDYKLALARSISVELTEVQATCYWESGGVLGMDFEVFTNKVRPEVIRSQILATNFTSVLAENAKATNGRTVTVQVASVAVVPPFALTTAPPGTSTAPAPGPAPSPSPGGAPAPAPAPGGATTPSPSPGAPTPSPGPAGGTTPAPIAATTAAAGVTTAAPGATTAASSATTAAAGATTAASAATTAAPGATTAATTAAAGATTAATTAAAGATTAAATTAAAGATTAATTAVTTPASTAPWSAEPEPEPEVVPSTTASR